VDGVLHAARGPGMAAGLRIFELPQMLNLRRLVESVDPAAKIVLTSNWRKLDMMKSKVQDELLKIGIAEGIYASTDVLDGSDRHTEIYVWLQKFKPSRFVIIDDVNLHAEFSGSGTCLKRFIKTGIFSCTKNHFVCTDFIDGLNRKSTDMCIDILRNRIWG
jgi:hypothetical protein